MIVNWHVRARDRRCRAVVVVGMIEKSGSIDFGSDEATIRGWDAKRELIGGRCDLFGTRLRYDNAWKKRMDPLVQFHV